MHLFGVLVASSLASAIAHRLNVHLSRSKMSPAFEDGTFCTPPLPHFRMRMCVRLFAQDSKNASENSDHDHDHGHSEHSHVVVNGIPLLVGPSKIIEEHGGQVATSNDLLKEIPNIVMEQGWLGCPTCREGMKICKEGQACHSDPETGESFPWQTLKSQGLHELFSAQCADIGHLISHKGVHDILHTVPAAHHLVDNKIKHDVANWIAGEIMHKILHGTYCIYLAEHSAGTTLTGGNSQEIFFPEDSICIEQLWAMEAPKLLNVLGGWRNDMPPSPLVCWSVAGGFNQPVVPWMSESFNADGALPEEVRKECKQGASKDRCGNCAMAAFEASLAAEIVCVEAGCCDAELAAALP